MTFSMNGGVSWGQKIKIGLHAGKLPPVESGGPSRKHLWVEGMKSHFWTESRHVASILLPVTGDFAVESLCDCPLISGGAAGQAGG